MSISTAYPVRAPRWILTYRGVDVTADVSRDVRSITYVDHLDGLSGDLEIELEDHDRRWQSSWMPSLGDSVSLLIGYQGGALLPCGDFQVDEVELCAPPDVMRLRCLTAYITAAMRTRRSVGYEDVTLLAIAQAVAERYGLALIYAGDDFTPVFDRVTQTQESDLRFLKRLANEHGYDFTIRGAQLVFYLRAALIAADASTTIQRRNTAHFSIRNRTRDVYRSAEIAYHDMLGKELIDQSASAILAVASGDAFKVATRVGNGQEALIKAVGLLGLSNLAGCEGELSLEGDTALAAGLNIQLADFGAYDGIYLIRSARHRLTRSQGYTTDLEVNRVR